MKLADISIHIVNWNSGEMLRQCLNTVFEQDYRAIKEVLVVDNASTDNSLKTIEREFPKVKIVRNYTNLGFSKAHNQAIRLSTGELVLVLNFDILLNQEFVSRMVLAMCGDPKIGMASGKLLRLLKGQKTDLLDSTGIIMARYFSSPRGSGEKDNGQYDGLEDRAIFGPCGAAAVYRREMLEDIKYQQEYFDEDFVNYVEDVDLAWRAQLRGWRGIYVPDAIAYHERGVTRKNNAAEQKNYFVWGYRNRYLAIYKNVTRHELRKFFFKIGLVEMLFILSRQDGGVPPGVKFKALREARLLSPLFKKNETMSRTGSRPLLKLFLSFLSTSIFQY
ncbi:MAG: glycosyltransferase family 2 protein [Candidatus Omnitrophota bacterium]